MTPLEEDLRTMLRARADGVAASAPPWDELSESTTIGIAASRRRRVPVAVAAVVLLLVAAVSVWLVRPSDEREVPVLQGPPDALPFDPASAGPVWVSEPSVDAAGAAAAYLGERLDVEPQLGRGEVDGELGLTSFPWSYADGTSGRVHLRRIGGGWGVVGATDDEVVVRDVSNRDGRLKFTASVARPTDSLAIAVFADGRPLALGGERLPQGSLADPTVGELFQLSPVAPVRIDVALPAVAAGAPVVRVRQVGGGLLSVSEFRAEPAGGPEGGRLVARGPAGRKAWEIWGMDRADGTDEAPCAVLIVDGQRQAGPVCGATGGDPRDNSSFSSMGPALREEGITLYFGVVEAEVVSVEVTGGPSRQTARIVPFTDPVHPDGARFFAVAVPAGDVEVRLRRADGQLVEPQRFAADDPVGG